MEDKIDNTLVAIAEESMKLTQSYLHKSLPSEMIEQEVLDKLAKKSLFSLGLDGNNVEFRKMLVNMYYLGEVNKDTEIALKNCLTNEE